MNKNAQPLPPGFVPPPPYDAQQQQHQQQQQQSAPHMVVVTGEFGSKSQRMTCPHCHANISTRVETEANTKTHMMAILLCVFFCWCCAPCPYFTDSCLVQKHYCPSCGACLGSCDN